MGARIYNAKGTREFPADYIINEYLGNDIKECDDWIENTLMTRYPKEVIFYEA